LKDAAGRNALHKAAYYSIEFCCGFDFKLFKILIEAGCDVNSKDMSSKTPLDELIWADESIDDILKIARLFF